MFVERMGPLGFEKQEVFRWLLQHVEAYNGYESPEGLSKTLTKSVRNM